MSLHKLLTRLILLCVGPLILLAIFLSISSVLSKQAERDGQARSLAKSVATTIDQHLQARISALHMLSESGLVDDPSHWKELYTEARGFYQGFGSHVILADPEMRMLFNTRVPFGSKLPKLPRPKGYAAAPAALETGKPAVGDIFFGPIAREPLVAIAVPAQRKGTATFLLLTIFETQQFQKYIDQVDLPPRWAIAILDGNGKAIARRAPASPLFAMNADTYRPIIIKSSASQWSVVLEMPRHIYSLAMIETVIALFAAFLTITLLSLLGGVLISRRLGKAIASLAETPATDAPPPDINEIAAVRRLLDASAEKREQAEEALRETRDYLENLLQYANAPIIVWSPNFKITRFNHAFETMTGRMVDEVLGKSIDLLFPDETREESLGHIHKTSIGEHWETIEIPILRKDETVRSVLWNSATIFGTDGKTVIATIAQGQDITESKQAAKALRESEVRYRRLFESAKDGILILDAKTGMILDVNPFLIALLGFSHEAFLGKKVWELGFFRDIIANQTSFLELQNRQYVRYEDKPLETADGRRIEVEFISNVYLVNHQKVIQCNIRDISDRKRAEEDRVAREAADEASRAKSAFVANMSHEIRTPLNAILGFANVLERDPSLTLQQNEHVRTISRSGTHLLKLINDILDISKIEAGRTTLNKAAFCLYDLLDDLEMMFRSRADAKGLQLVMERDESVSRYVTADEGKLRQVFVNLLGNAVKFTETGGVAVRVRAEAVAEKTVKGTEALRLVAEVEDTGPGIPDGDMGRIFDVFQQAESGVKAGGTGLGLAISRKFVEMMGGKFTVTSHVGKGSCFRFEVLLEQAEEVAERGIPASRRIVGLEPGTGPLRILVVDDTPDNRALLSTLLQPVGFEIAEATNGVEALEVFARWAPHAILMDMRMPVMDGYEATRRLKSTEAGQATPIIAVTASAFDDSRKQVMATGVDAYLRKPFRPEELFEVLGKCIGLHYVFADETDKPLGHPKTPPITPESLAMLPKELIQAMRQAVAEGDMTRLTELIGQVEKVDSTTARNLRALADSYEYEKLGQWLEKGGSDNG